jgi:hypothetical protein
VKSDLLAEKIESIPLSLINGDFLNNFSNADINEISEKIEESQNVFEQYISNLNEDIKKRESFVILLTELLEKQEIAMQKSQSFLQHSQSQLYKLSQTKSNIKNLVNLSNNSSSAQNMTSISLSINNSNSNNNNNNNNNNNSTSKFKKQKLTTDEENGLQINAFTMSSSDNFISDDSIWDPNFTQSTTWNTI